MYKSADENFLVGWYVSVGFAVVGRMDCGSRVQVSCASIKHSILVR